jgi:pimeloyl-ACP methyl ester carboxylesterase
VTWLAVHGVPVGPLTWSRLRTPVKSPALTSVDWRDWVAQVRALVTPETLLIGHDLGGLVAATVAATTPVRAVVLTGTALGPYWDAVRWTSSPPVRWYFYDRHAGRKFVAGGVGPAARPRWTAMVEPTLPDDVAGQMCQLASGIRPPRGLARRLRAVPVWVIHGRSDPWYPPWVARAVARGCGARRVEIDGGHWCMWENPSEFDAALRAVGAASGALAQGLGPERGVGGEGLDVAANVVSGVGVEVGEAGDVRVGDVAKREVDPPRLERGQLWR